MDETPTLEDDTFVDPAIATCSLALWPRKDGAMTNAVQLLVRPLDTRGDESGGHPGERFVMVTITREEVRAMLAALEQDMADCVRTAGAGGAAAMSRWPHERYHAEPVYDVHDCGTGAHERYISGWDVVTSEGIYAAGPFDSEPEAAEEAHRLNSAAKAEQEATSAGHQQHISAGAPEEETPDQREDRERWERAICRKESALHVLGPLGFEDLEDGEAPGAIYHRNAGVVLDAETLKPQDVVHELLRIGSERGVQALRRDLRAAIGI